MMQPTDLSFVDYIHLLSNFEHKMTKIVLRNEMLYIQRSILDQMSRTNQAKCIQASYSLLEESLATVHYTFALSKFDPLGDELFELLGFMNSHGLITNLDYKVPKAPVDGKEPQVLTVEHFSVCFIVIAIGWGLCVVVFLLEHAAHRLASFLKKI